MRRLSLNGNTSESGSKRTHHLELPAPSDGGALPQVRSPIRENYLDFCPTMKKALPPPIDGLDYFCSICLVPSCLAKRLYPTTDEKSNRSGDGDFTLANAFRVTQCCHRQMCQSCYESHMSTENTVVPQTSLERTKTVPQLKHRRGRSLASAIPTSIDTSDFQSMRPATPIPEEVDTNRSPPILTLNLSGPFHNTRHRHLRRHSALGTPMTAVVDPVSQSNHTKKGLYNHPNSPIFNDKTPSPITILENRRIRETASSNHLTRSPSYNRDVKIYHENPFFDSKTFGSRFESSSSDVGQALMKKFSDRTMCKDKRLGHFYLTSSDFDVERAITKYNADHFGHAESGGQGRRRSVGPNVIPKGPVRSLFVKGHSKSKSLSSLVSPHVRKIRDTLLFREKRLEDSNDSPRSHHFVRPLPSNLKMDSRGPIAVREKLANQPQGYIKIPTDSPTMKWTSPLKSPNTFKGKTESPGGATRQLSPETDQLTPLITIPRKSWNSSSAPVSPLHLRLQPNLHSQYSSFDRGQNQSNRDVIKSLRLSINCQAAQVPLRSPHRSPSSNFSSTDSQTVNHQRSKPLMKRTHRRSGSMPSMQLGPPFTHKYEGKMNLPINSPKFGSNEGNPEIESNTFHSIDLHKYERNMNGSKM